jgi:hypothetical protein
MPHARRWRLLRRQRGIRSVSDLVVSVASSLALLATITDRLTRSGSRHADKVIGNRRLGTTLVTTTWPMPTGLALTLSFAPSARRPGRKLAFRLPAHLKTGKKLDIAWSAADFFNRRTEVVLTWRKLRPFFSELTARIVLVTHTTRDGAHVRHSDAAGSSYAGRLDVEVRWTVSPSRSGRRLGHEAHRRNQHHHCHQMPHVETRALRKRTFAMPAA